MLGYSTASARRGSTLESVILASCALLKSPLAATLLRSLSFLICYKRFFTATLFPTVSSLLDKDSKMEEVLKMFLQIGNEMSEQKQQRKSTKVL